jgi:hypothetical protein
VTCVCGNEIDEGLERVAAIDCRSCRENPDRLRAALILANRSFDCPSPGCPQLLALDEETPVLRCTVHGPMEVIA